MSKSTRMLAVIALISLMSIIVILAFSSLSIVQASVLLLGASFAIAIIFYSYKELDRAITTYEKYMEDRDVF